MLYARAGKLLCRMTATLTMRYMVESEGVPRSVAPDGAWQFLAVSVGGGALRMYLWW